MFNFRNNSTATRSTTKWLYLFLTRKSLRRKRSLAWWNLHTRNLAGKGKFHDTLGSPFHHCIRAGWRKGKNKPALGKINPVESLSREKCWPEDFLFTEKCSAAKSHVWRFGGATFRRNFCIKFLISKSYPGGRNRTDVATSLSGKVLIETN